MLLGAGGLLIVLGSFLVLEFRSIIAPYMGETKDEVTVVSTHAPRLLALVRGTDIVIAQVDNKGEIVRDIYTSSLIDATADFVLFAVPQEHYSGIAYVRSLQDTENNLLIIYPLDITSGKLGPWVINTTSDAITLSANEEQLAVIDAQGTAQKITLYDMLTGTAATSWTMAPGEWLSADPYAAPSGYGGHGVHWVSATCFEHTVWHGAARRGTPLTDSETRTFCNN